MNRMLIVGASGVVGRAALALFDTLPGWDVVGISRRRAGLPQNRHVEVDLLDPRACAAFASTQAFTHVIYAALFEKPGLIAGWRDDEQMRVNQQMLENLMTPVLSNESLKHVSLLQGTKAYGAHVAPMRVPGKEREPRVEHANFYWLQEDWLARQCRRVDIGLTVWRPPLIFGHAFGAPMNVLSAIFAYAIICRAEGRPMAWPGGICGPVDGVDSGLLAQAFAWAAQTESSWGQTFNVTNGDVFVWNNVWPTIVQALGATVGPDQPMSLAAQLPEKAEVFDGYVRSKGLSLPSLMEFVGDSLIYADVYFNYAGTEPPPSTLLSTIKLRQSGFTECVDTEDCLVDWLTKLQADVGGGGVRGQAPRGVD